MNYNSLMQGVPKFSSLTSSHTFSPFDSTFSTIFFNDRSIHRIFNYMGESQKYPWKLSDITEIQKFSLSSTCKPTLYNGSRFIFLNDIHTHTICISECRQLALLGPTWAVYYFDAVLHPIKTYYTMSHIRKTISCVSFWCSKHWSVWHNDSCTKDSDHIRKILLPDFIEDKNYLKREFPTI